MKGWIYALEIAPSGRIKVGKTAALPRRLADHLGAADFSGCSVSRVMSFAVSDPDVAEADLIWAVTSLRTASLVHGKETFVGVAFMEVAAVADDIARRQQAPAADVQAEDLLDVCANAMDAARLTRASLDHLRQLLGDQAPLTNADLGKSLRRAGLRVDSIHCPHEGRTMRGIKREWIQPVLHVA